MQINPTLDKFYLSILKYAGMEYTDGYIKSSNPDIGDLKIDGKTLTLPYYDNLKNPDNRVIFHPLNENFSTPETVVLAAFKKRLTLDLNFRLYAAIYGLLKVGADINLQRKVKSPKLLKLLGALGEVDTNTIDNFASIVKHSQKVNEEAFLVDFHVKKNGSIKDNAHAAVGKVNFVLNTELNRALEDSSEGYRVFGAKVRKKDILSLLTVLSLLFPDIADEDAYKAGTDIKSFRFFNALLLSTYFVATEVNDIAIEFVALKDPDLAVDEMVSDLEWTEVIEKVYTMTDEIRSIPNQTDNRSEGRGLKVKEPVVVEPTTHRHATPVPPSFDPSNVPRSAPPPQAPVQQSGYPQAPVPQQPIAAPSVEDIIRGSVIADQTGNYYGGMQYPQQYSQQYPQPQQYQPQPQYPQQYPQPQQYQPQPQYPQQYPQPQQYQPQPQYPQQYPQPQQPPPQQYGIPINPQMLNNRY